MSLAKDFKADLHVHTSFSDGTDSPFQILEKAKEANLSGLSITDHDTTEAYDKLLFVKAKEEGISLLSGVEISTRLQEEEVHILGYGFDLQSESFQAFLQKNRDKRKERNQKILENLKKKKIIISEEELSSLPTKVIGRPHIAFLLEKKGIVSSFQEAFDLYLKKGASCFCLGEKASTIEAIEAIQKASGKAVLAHPHFFKKKNLIQKLLQFPFDGIECYYAYFSLKEEEKWLEIADKKGWIPTGGSDYHGSIKPANCLGRSWVGWEVFQRLMQNG